MDGFQRRREIKMKQILEGALSLFLKHGVQKVSVAEIAKEANVSQVTIYNYFENKHKLTNEVISYYIEESWLEAEELIDSDLPFPEKIKQVIYRNTKVANNIHEDFYQYLMKEYTTNNSDINKFYADRVIPRLAEFFSIGKEQGYIDPTISNEAIMFYLQMFSEYISKEEVSQQSHHLSEELTKLFFYGITGKKVE
ncbi:TetR/AcrR family transcriptional regulator [Ornithinibacillus xuwenensis]|uniref:TetR/AcrR family transcriptional regulator n=1 Tax=Ornithinibacillus xuwenensis TaxID=3144668 RepID=A0ABU9XLK7_9BACI